MASLLYEEDTYSPLDHHHQTPEKTVLVGIHGFASSGKDTSGNALIARRGYERVSFAEPLRELSFFVNPVVRWDYYGNSWSLNEVVEDLGYEEAKKVGSTRHFLQRLGEGVRNILGESTWVDAAMAKVQPGGKYVFTDVRFENEALAVRSRGGMIIEVVRPGIEGVNDHVSEKRLPDHLIDVTIENDGTIEDLAERINNCAIWAEATAR